jgi:chemotaxis protein histidine kinase CheA
VGKLLQSASKALRALALLEKTIEPGEKDQVRMQAHTVKGAAANIAAEEMRNAAEIMEMAHFREISVRCPPCWPLCRKDLKNSVKLRKAERQ